MEFVRPKIAEFWLRFAQVAHHFLHFVHRFLSCVHTGLVGYLLTPILIQINFFYDHLSLFVHSFLLGYTLGATIIHIPELFLYSYLSFIHFMALWAFLHMADELLLVENLFTDFAEQSFSVRSLINQRRLRYKCFVVVRLCYYWIIADTRTTHVQPFSEASASNRNRLNLCWFLVFEWLLLWKAIIRMQIERF